MPYCPKCDMEFIDGITTCSDCGGELVESKEAAMELKKQEEEARREQMLKEMAMAEKNQINPDDFFANDCLILNEVDGDTEGNTEAKAPSPQPGFM